MRNGEAFAVNLNNLVAGDVYRITEQVNQTTKTYGRLKHRKPTDYRDVPLPARIRETIQWYADKHGTVDGYLLRHPQDPTKPYLAYYLQNQWQRIKRAGESTSRTAWWPRLPRWTVVRRRRMNRCARCGTEAGAQVHEGVVVSELSEPGQQAPDQDVVAGPHCPHDRLDCLPHRGRQSHKACYSTANTIPCPSRPRFHVVPYGVPLDEAGGHRSCWRPAQRGHARILRSCENSQTRNPAEDPYPDQGMPLGSFKLPRLTGWFSEKYGKSPRQLRP
ncbi:hypothetical protein [Streptomyces virginiae]|uniref:hypothetical protein n=1 Tax=Streptomyces virginiae TaxID=1961 RepID=UPI003658E6F6